MKCPAKLQLSREDGEALRTRLKGDALTAVDRQGLDQVLEWYFWLLLALQEATVSLKRLRALVLGEPRSKRQISPPGASADAGGGPGETGHAPGSAVAEAIQGIDAGKAPSTGERRWAWPAGRTGVPRG
jgi:hypothetical protein